MTSSVPDENERQVAGTLPHDAFGDTEPMTGPERVTKDEPKPIRAAEQTDVGNSALFVREHGGDLRFVGSWGKWVYWDGKRWALDQTGRAEHLAKGTVGRMLDAAMLDVDRARQAFGLAEKGNDDELRKRAADRLARANKGLSWALTSHSAARVRAMVELSRSAPELAITHEQLDADPWLLNVANGTLDLRTGELRAHAVNDLMTKVSPVSFDPKATCPIWDRFLQHAMGGNQALISFLQRMIGYSMTGVIREHALIFNHGDGANGKSTFIATIHALLGDYAVRAPRHLLFKSKNERHETELTTVFGARFVSCAEVPEGAVFDEALVKDLTGGDAVTARRMREDHWTFSPTHKLALAGNHKPIVRGIDHGIWRRMRLVPWEVTVSDEQRDTQLPEKLRAELAGILSWALRGCLEWQRQGLDDPAEVKNATAAYRDQSDPLREFFASYCVFGNDERIPRLHLREAYAAYCDENGAEPLGARRFAEGLRQRGVTDIGVRHHTKVMNGWRGVRLLTDAERERKYLVGSNTEKVPKNDNGRIHHPVEESAYNHGSQQMALSK